MASEEAPYPIWWSPSLELESLDKIDERMSRTFWHNPNDGFPVAKSMDPDSERALVNSCESYFKLTSEGYYATKNIDYKPLAFQASICHALDMLRTAAPSPVSYVDAFKLSEDALDVLPAMMGPAYSCDSTCRRFVANQRRESWQRFEASKFETIDIVNDHEMVVTTDTDRVMVQIVARADFNHDGTEDILFRVNESATHGTWGTTYVLDATRDSHDGVLWTFDAEKSLCPDYSCSGTFGFTEAIEKSKEAD